jgi:hypothetical protein
MSATLESRTLVLRASEATLPKQTEVLESILHRVKKVTECENDVTTRATFDSHVSVLLDRRQFSWLNEQSVRNLALAVLERSGFTVLAPCDGEERLSKGHSGDIQRMITDAIMPGMRGRELGQQAATPGSKAFSYSAILTML